MPTRRQALAGIAATALMPLAAVAQTRPLKVGFYQFPPYTLVDQGKAGGVLFDIWDQITAKLDLRYTTEELPPARLVATLAAAGVDVALLPPSYAEFKDTVLSSQQPIEHVLLVACSRADGPVVKGAADLAGHRVIVRQGYRYGTLLDYIQKPDNKVTLAASVQNAVHGLQALAADRGDVFLSYRQEIDVARRDVALDGLVVQTLSDLPIHVNLSRAVPDAAAVMARIDGAIAARPAGA